MTPSKRLFDLTFAVLISFVLALPFLALIVALLVREGRPVFYVATRMKTPDRSFRLWKLRTMTVAAGERGVSGGDKSVRVTQTGRFLRKYRLDEIPQLWNVFRGDMSFVGPRPPLPEYVEKFPEIYEKVLKARPGVTGTASLIFHAHEERLLAGCRTPEETETVYCRRCIPRKARLDLVYLDNRSLCFDAVLMARTALRIFRRNR